MKLINRVKAFIIDFIIWLYLLGAGKYFADSFDFDISIYLIFPIAIFVAAITHFIKDSPGLALFGENKKLWYKSISGWLVVLVVIMTLAVGWSVVEVDLYKFFTKGANAKGIVSGLFDPNFKILELCLSALMETIFLALLATVLAIPLAFILSFFAARNLMPKTFLGNLVYYIVRTIATIFRSIEAVVWAIIFSVWVGIGPFAGMLALMIHSVAALTKLYSEQIENIDQGQVEAIKATGASTLQVWAFAVIPQIISPYLAFTIYRWDINVRMATIVGFVGGGGIGLLLLQQQQMLRWHNVGLIIWLIALVVWIMDMVSGKVREKLQEM